ncbi:MAG: VOC family protein [Terriglobales bacterium]|jgi:uncharacterized glyoxalase superfamily protein PhnB
MIQNRSVPPDTILPHIVYQNVDDAIAWLAKTFGFSEHYRYGNPTSGAQMHLGNAWIMVRGAREGSASPSKLGYGTQSLTVFVDDLDAHYARSKAAGAKLVENLHETEYGELQYAAEDLDGHHWLFSRHVHDRSPEEWGATVAQSATMAAQISPMLAVNDGNAAIEFYKTAFGATLLWHLDRSVAGLAVNGGKFFLAEESPPHGTRSPASVGFTTVRIELFVDDPIAVHRQAVAAGATERTPVSEHKYPTTGPRPIKRMLQGSILDPFGHMWLIGKILE